MDGRVDCGFPKLPAKNDFETLFLQQDRLSAVLSEGHNPTKSEHIPISEPSKKFPLYYMG